MKYLFPSITVRHTAHLCRYMGLLKGVPDDRISTLANHFKIDIKTHGALDGAAATKGIVDCLIQLLQLSKTHAEEEVLKLIQELQEARGLVDELQE